MQDLANIKLNTDPKSNRDVHSKNILLFEYFLYSNIH